MSLSSYGKISKGFRVSALCQRWSFDDVRKSVQSFDAVQIANHSEDRFGSSTDKIRCPPHVCFAPDNRLRADIAARRLRAIKRRSPSGTILTWQMIFPTTRLAPRAGDHSDNSDGPHRMRS